MTQSRSGVMLVVLSMFASSAVATARAEAASTEAIPNQPALNDQSVFELGSFYSRSSTQAGVSGASGRAGVVALPLGAGGEKLFVGGIGTPEMRERFSETTHEVVIFLDNGGHTMVQRHDGASFRVGDRVRVQGTQLELLAP